MDYPQRPYKLLPSQIYEMVTLKERKLAVTGQSLRLTTESAQRDYYRDHPAIYTVKLFDVPEATAVDVLREASREIETLGIGELPPSEQSFDALFHQFVTERLDWIFSANFSDEFASMNRLLRVTLQAPRLWTTRRSYYEGACTSDAIEMTVAAAMKNKKVLRFDYETTVDGKATTTTRRVRLRGYRRLRNGEWGFSAERCGQIKTYSLKKCSNVHMESNPGKRMVSEAELRLELTGVGARLVLENATE